MQEKSSSLKRGEQISKRTHKEAIAVSLDQAEEFSGINKHTLRKLIKKGYIKAFRTGLGKQGKLLICTAEIKNFIALREAEEGGR
ncbi:MAG: hypothetical protein L6Q71_08850 [Planctomycetes bacterium]|nr:hypothetical protein [Planctomycetota bacterium]NUQ36163.1 hypothetical protein [Planctomycetaceae bacterium]